MEFDPKILELIASETKVYCYFPTIPGFHSAEEKNFIFWEFQEFYWKIMKRITGASFFVADSIRKKISAFFPHILWLERAAPALVAFNVVDNVRIWNVQQTENGAIVASFFVEKLPYPPSMAHFFYVWNIPTEVGRVPEKLLSISSAAPSPVCRGAMDDSYMIRGGDTLDILTLSSETLFWLRMNSFIRLGSLHHKMHLRAFWPLEPTPDARTNWVMIIDDSIKLVGIFEIGFSHSEGTLRVLKEGQIIVDGHILDTQKMHEWREGEIQCDMHDGTLIVWSKKWFTSTLFKYVDVVVAMELLRIASWTREKLAAAAFWEYVWPRVLETDVLVRYIPTLHKFTNEELRPGVYSQMLEMLIRFESDGLLESKHHYDPYLRDLAMDFNPFSVTDNQLNSGFVKRFCQGTEKYEQVMLQRVPDKAATKLLDSVSQLNISSGASND